MLQDPPADLVRKESLWQQLHKTHERDPDAIVKILAENLNVRMHARPQSHLERVGPNVWGLEEDLILPERTNRT